MATPRYSKYVGSLLPRILKLLLVDQSLPENYGNHVLSVDWTGYRECHVKPDLLLTCRKPDADTLRLARLDSHSELFN
ncbi:type II toxin-antitoxin system YafQ family toxin [Candidatus Nitrotoga sp. 1052]|uniref:type II toxin-antitoxin system YafQ family toxin n=1 Tax=Candidatus Nitrotoga sp. 1052 TaxID=2886964 RepID=UPI0021123C3A|nr:type II toxin-antitoxin system YafQ family toxin [Candidatus Nitrotoga sp. 1052]